MPGGLSGVEKRIILSARAEVGRLVGRDTETLSEAEIVRATVESVR